eukprot:COSAG01_NODE_48140_length_383_cov_9.130282_1_plen_90_part_01
MRLILDLSGRCEWAWAWAWAAACLQRWRKSVLEHSWLALPAWLPACCSWLMAAARAQQLAAAAAAHLAGVPLLLAPLARCRRLRWPCHKP